MQPYNYIVETESPMASALRGYGTGLRFQDHRQRMALNDAAEARAQELHPLAMEGAGLGLDAQRQNMAIQRSEEARRQQRFAMDVAAARQQAAERAAQQAQQAARQQAYSQAIQQVHSLGEAATAADYGRLVMEFPEMSKALSAGFDMMDEAQKRGTVQVLGPIAAALKTGNTEGAIGLSEQYAAAAENSGRKDLADTARAMSELMRADPRSAQLTIGATLMSMGDRGESVARLVFGAGGADRKLAGAPQEYPNGTIQYKYDDGSVETVLPSGERLTGQAAMDAIKEARQEQVDFYRDKGEAAEGGKLEARIESGGIAKATEALGSEQANFVKDALGGADKVAKNIGNIDEAIAAIDAGGRSGPIDRFLPNITEASASLRNAMDRMGLDVIASVTFGALSEGEMDLAMQTAVPRGLKEDALRDWLVRKRDAQRKARVALMEQAMFLSDPKNTMADWVKMVEGVSGGASAPSTSSARDSGDYSEFFTGADR